MPVTKNASLRYRLIDECLQRRQVVWTPARLLDTVADKFFQNTGQKLSKRQFNQDLADLKEGGSSGYQAPLAYTRDQGYHYTEPGFSIHNSPLLSDDAAVLRQALAALQQFQGLGLSEELDAVVQRVEAHLQAQAGAADEPPVIWFEQVPDYAGTPFLAPLYRAIRARQVLRLHYQPFGVAEALVETVQPQLLKEYNRRWFLLATSAARPGLVSQFALDRVVAAEPLPGAAYEPAAWEPAAYFADVVGVSVPAGVAVAEVRLLFRQGRGNYVRTKPLHPSQQVQRSSADELEITLRLRPNPELETLVLGFGEAVEVLAPAALRARVAARLRAAAGQYVGGAA